MSTRAIPSSQIRSSDSATPEEKWIGVRGNSGFMTWTLLPYLSRSRALSTVITPVDAMSLMSGDESLSGRITVAWTISPMAPQMSVAVATARRGGRPKLLVRAR